VFKLPRILAQYCLNVCSWRICGSRTFFHLFVAALLFVPFTCYTFLKSSEFSALCFICLESSHLSSKGKVLVNFESNSRITIAGPFPEPCRSGSQLFLSDSSRHATAYGEWHGPCAVRVRNEWDVSSTYMALDFTSTLLETKERDRLKSAYDLHIVLSVCTADSVWCYEKRGVMPATLEI
jgi:hypothetical protein